MLINLYYLTLLKSPVLRFFDCGGSCLRTFRRYVFGKYTGNCQQAIKMFTLGYIFA
jgi:hypothetical protein